MKFKRMLAALLGAMMIVSCMSFTANAQEDELSDGDVIEEVTPDEEAEEIAEEPAEEPEEAVEEEAALAEETSEETPATVTITFDRQNGAFKKETVNGVKNTWVNYSVSKADFAVGDTVVFPAEGEYIYHTFKGWSTEKNGAVITDLSAVTATEAKTYYGVWEWNLAKGTPVEAIYARTEDGYMATENGTSGGVLYDATTGTVYKRFLGATEGNKVRCNMYNGLKYSLPGSEFHMVALVRTNMTSGGKSSAGIYSSSKKNGDSISVGTVYSSYDFSEEDAGEWKKIHLSSTNFSDFGIGTHVDFDVTNGVAVKDIENDYFDVAGIAIFGTSEEAQAFDIAGATAYTGTAVVSFDAQTAEDNSDVTTTYPASLTKEGYKLTGWASDAEGTTPVDITKVPVPKANVTYYAVWDEVHTINFHKNDGSDTVETYSIVDGDEITAPTFTADGKTFLGWATEADSTEIVEVDATASADKDYYAVWTSLWLTELIVNGNDFDASTKNGKLYGINNLTSAYRLDLVMPYGYPTSVIPTIVGTANLGTVTYTAPETFDGTGSVTITSGETNVVLPVTFAVADKSTVKDLNFVPTEGVNDKGRGLYAITKSTDKGISATKFIPIYTEESEYYKKTTDANGTVTGGFLPQKSANIEGWAAFNGNTGVNLESYDQYRALIYYDTGANGKRDVTATPSITTTNYGTRGPLRSKATSLASGAYKTGRWEYAYFNVAPAGITTVYGWSKQFSFGLFGSSPASVFTDDVLYVAKIDLLVDGDEKYLQYKPTELSATDETSAKNDGTITGVASDMEVSVDGGEYVAITTFAGFNAETGVLGGLDGGTYSLRYAESETHAASEAVEVTVVSYDAELTFYSNIDDTTTVFAEKEVPKGSTVDVLPLISDIKNADHATLANDIVARPARQGYILKGWASSAEATAPEEIDTTKSGKYYAVWEAIPEENILTADEDYTLTIVDGTEVTASPAPADALSFYRGDEAGSFMTNSEGIAYGTTPEGMTSFKGVSLTDKTTIASWYGGNSQNTVLYPNGRATNIWYKLNDSYISAKPGIEGEYYISYHIYTGTEGTIRAFNLDVPGKSGVVYLNGTNVEGELAKDHFVTVRADLTADSELKYSAALDFDDEVVKGAQLMGIYIWPSEKQVLKNKYGADAEIVFVSNAGAGAKDGSSPENAYATLATAMSAKASVAGKVVFAILDDVKITSNGEMAVAKDMVITSAGGNIYATSHPTFKTNGGSNIVIENIDIYHTRATGDIDNEIYLVARGNDLTLRNVNGIAYSAQEGKTRTAKLFVQPGGDGGNFTKAGNTQLVLENVTGVEVRGGGYGGSTFAGGIDYVIGGKSDISLNTGIQAVGASVQKTVDDDLQYDTDGNPVTNQSEANRTVKGDIAVTVQDEANISTITATGYGILKGDLTITVKDDATVGTVNFTASSTKKKNQAGDTDVVMAAGRLEGNGIVYILGGSVGTVKGTQGAKRAVVVDLNNAQLPATVSNVNHKVTYKGNGTVTIAYAEDGTATISLAPGTNAKYVKITTGGVTKTYNVSGNEVTLMADLSALPVAEGTTTVEFLSDGTEGKTITWINGDETVKTELVEVGTMPTAPELTKTGYSLSWTPTVAQVTDEATYTAVWEANKHNVIYTLDGTEYDKTEVAYGTTVEILAAPAAREGYTFSGWKIDGVDAANFTMPDKDVEITGTWTLNNYTITFDAGEGAFLDGSKTKTVGADHGTTPAAPETPSLDGYTFKEWTPAITTATADTTYTATYDKNETEDSFPTTPTYKTYGVYDAEKEIYEVELRLSGTTANVGSFGFTFPAEYMTLTSVTANEDAGVALLPEVASDEAQVSPIFVKDATTGAYANTFTGELADGYGYVDATQSEVLIATFTFTMTADQRTAFEADILGGRGKFEEYVVANADEKYHDGTNYLVAPYSTDLSTNKEAVVYASHTDTAGDVEDITASITLTVKLAAGRGTEGTSLAALKINDGTAVIIETAGVGSDITYTVENLEIGETYKLRVEKNGYIAGVCEVTLTQATNTLEMTLISGDIKGEATASCGDGTVNLDDFVRLIRAFDQEAGDDFKAAVDINEDGAVSVSDLGCIKTNYNKTTEDTVITFNGTSVTPGASEAE